MIHAMQTAAGALGGQQTYGIGQSNVDLEKLANKGLSGIAGAIQQNVTTPAFNFSQASAIPPAVTGTANIAMSPSANNNASTPVFSENTQQAAEKVFGSQDQRQGSVNGFKQEVKDRIMSDVASL
jgi:hypothetical protein